MLPASTAGNLSCSVGPTRDLVVPTTTAGVTFNTPGGPIGNIRMLWCQIILVVALPAGPLRSGIRVAFLTIIVCPAMVRREGVTVPT